ncbi:relaxase MobL [Clostridium perfringens]|uniref:relaxase MobL n=1 Tax=Clostridium perfringens TaxID=1502 RepID=UPI0024BC2EA1|nr:relaxase MobL [Clostridium perfringens]
MHIHITCMERKNTREMIEYDGVEQARGKRKLSTLDDMIFKFGSKMLDRTNEFEKLSILRKEVPLEIKESVRNCLIQMYIEKNTSNDSKFENYLRELKEEIPINIRGYNELPKLTKDKVDELTDYLTKDNPKRKEYDSVTKQIDELYQQTFGKRYNPNEFYENRKADFNARMGNAVVLQIKKMKKDEQKVNKKDDLKEFISNKKMNVDYVDNKYQYKTKYGTDEYLKFKEEMKKKQEISAKREEVYRKKRSRFADRRDLHKIDRAIKDDLQMYRAKRDYEELEARIEQEKLRQLQESTWEFS